MERFFIMFQGYVFKLSPLSLSMQIIESLVSRTWKALEIRIIGVRMYGLSVETMPTARQESDIPNMQSKKENKQGNQNFLRKNLSLLLLSLI